MGATRTNLRARRPASIGSVLGVAVIAALAYLPSLTARPGRMPADTKVYLYLDPGRLLADATTTWDTSQFAGWVPHQLIAYLWPSGPWFWSFDALGVPDWVAHRLWLGTILFLGGLGVRWACRHLGLTAVAATTAAIVYQLSPYVLPYVSRTSVMLLPWAGLGWLVGLTVRASTRTRWRDAALFALVVVTVGAVNATALALVAPAPVLWLVHAAWQRMITWRTAAVTAAKLGGLSLAVSVWWIAMLWIQGRHGADVLSFSETLEAVARTSVSTETLRGLGYWLFYVRDPWGFTTTASVPYMESGRVILAGYAVTAVGLLGIAVTRWSERRYAALLVFAGIVLAVGVHPIDDPSPLMAPVEDSALGLALRSSTRALPLSLFGLALGAGALVTALSAVRTPATRRFAGRSGAWPGAGAAVVIVALALVNLPALRTDGFVDPALERDQDPPDAWVEAAAALDSGSLEHRVLQLPGAEFGAFRWGYTVDPPLPGLTDKPLVTRDLLPLGSPAAMDLLYALDNRFQSGTVEPGSIAPIARFLAADTIWLSNDAAFDRFRTPRPEVAADLFAAEPPGLGPPVAFGDPQPNVPVLEMIDEERLSDARIGAPLPPVALVPVTDPQSVVRASTDVVVVAGSGDGLVDAAAAGLLHGDEVVLYAADLTAAELAELPEDTPLIVTDSNRDRAMHWRGSQDVLGMTESGGPGADVTREDDADERLAVFGDLDPTSQTTARLEGGLVVRASAYGEPAAYRPEQRPAMAVDGDPDTAWVVADRGDPLGHSIELSTTDGRLVVLQPQDSRRNRVITQITVEQPGRDPAEVVLGPASLTQPGQVVDVIAGEPVTITIDEVTVVAGSDSGPAAVGFAELGPVAREVVRPPSDALAAAGNGALAIVLTRERVQPSSRWRSDPEPALVREVEVPSARTLELTVTLRLSRRAPDQVLAALRREPDAALANRRLAGVPDARGASAVDADPSTRWTTPFGEAAGSELTVPLARSTTVSSLTITQPMDLLHSRITQVRVRIGDVDVDLELPPPDPSGRSTVTFPSATGDALTLTIKAVEPRLTRDRRYGELVELPAAIIEIEGLATARPEPLPADSPPCRDDLLSIDGQPVALAADATVVDRLLAGETVDVGVCAQTANQIELAAGAHLVTSAAGVDTGIDVDRVVLSSGMPTPGPSEQPPVAVSRDGTSRVATVAACPTGCWLVMGEGYNSAWRAIVVDDEGLDAELGAPRQVAGGFNGWRLPPSDTPTTVLMTWPPQRTLHLALALTALAVVACIAIAALDRRRTTVVVVPDAPDIDDRPLLASWRDVAGRRESVGAAAVLVTVSGLVIAPLWTLIALAPAAVVVVLRRPALLAVGAAALAGALGMLVLWRVRQHRYFVDAGWPSHFEDLHRAGVFVVVLLLAGCVTAGRRSTPRRGAGPST